LRLVAEHPERVRAVVLISGSARLARLVRRIPDTRAVPWVDAPDRVAGEIVDFLARLEGR